MSKSYIAELQSTIQRLHKCQASHSRTELSDELVNGQVMWSGMWKCLRSSATIARLRCYAWGHLHDNGQWEVTTVLAIPPVVSAESAALAAFCGSSEGRGATAVGWCFSHALLLIQHFVRCVLEHAARIPNRAGG
jgi:hypothetical protein